MRPANLDEVVGQQRLLAQGAAFRTMVEAGRPVSMILWGPPGSGKTTLARLVAVNSRARFEQLSATSAGVKDVREVLAMATRRIEDGDGRTVLFLDEIHRFNKAQQDALLPGVEDGIIILVGATTENPFFEVNSPLISRSSVFRTEELAPDEVVDLLRRAMDDPVRGLPGAAIDDEALDDLAHRVGGDARLALNGFELAVTIAEGREKESVGLDEVAEALQRRVIRYDKDGDRHYDVISAFIKSVRGSDPDAALYWLHTMIEAGEDPKFIAQASGHPRFRGHRPRRSTGPRHRGRRIPGSRGDRHPRGCLRPDPRDRLPGDRAQVELAVKRHSGCPRSGGEHPRCRRPAASPLRRDTGEQAMGHGVGYAYPHDDPLGVVRQQYLPDEARDATLYRPGDHGEEAEIGERLGRIDRILGRKR